MINKPMRLLLLVFEIGGGFAGLPIAVGVLCGQVSTGSSMSSDVRALALALFCLLGIVAGIALIAWPRLGLGLSFVFQILQVIVVFSPYVSYFAFSGLRMGAVWTQGRPRFFGSIGARVGFGFGYPHEWSIGVNVVALAFTIYLVRQLVRTRATQKNVRAPEENSPQDEKTQD